MKKVYLVPNIVTAFGLACGLFVIFKMNMIEPGASSYNLLFAAAILLLIAAVADVVDGAIARFIRAESEFGVQFDSLSDGITFGVAPSVVILKTLSVPAKTGLSFIVTAAAMVYTVCGVLRLVRFNVNSNKQDDDQLGMAKKNFTGLPIPVAAIAAVSANLFLESEDFYQFFTITPEVRAIVLSVVMAVLGYFMISRWKFPSLKTLHFRVPSYPLVFVSMLIAALILFGIPNHFPVVFVCVPWTYLVVAWILSLIRVIAGRKSHTLEDFEPESED